jgi:DNA (cytosine-5)-methyltransferase 1
MREWPGFATNGGASGHVTRYLPRDWRIFGRMAPGDQYPEAHALAEALFREALAELAASGAAPEMGSEAFLALRTKFVPPYDATKFPNKWRKMEPDQPARTLMAHLGKDTYSHIHYDSSQARTITVREAARLQSFPDGFVFRGAMNAAFRQIGNAVPPLLAAAVAKRIYQTLQRTSAVEAEVPHRVAAG